MWESQVPETNEDPTLILGWALAKNRTSCDMTIEMVALYKPIAEF